jgi:hypothetical protein
LEIFFVADENSDRDLFGEPVVELAKGRGRPAHQPTRETRNRVILGFARGRSVKEVALSIGVSVPTLREHYSSAVAARQAMALMVESVQLGRLNDQAEKGNVTAEKELLKALEKGRLNALASEAANGANRPPKLPKPGKKEAAVTAAKNVGGRFQRRPAPSLLNPSGSA